MRDHRDGAPRRNLAELARLGEWDEVEERLCAGADPDDRGLAGDTALFWACAEDHAEAVESLLDSGASVDAIADSILAGLEPGGQLNAWEVVVIGAAPAACRILARQGPAPRRCFQRAMTPLHWASLEGSEGARACAQELLDAGLDPSGVSSQSETPLAFAIALGNQGMVETLLRAGALPHEALAQGENAPFAMRHRGQGPTSALLAAIEPHAAFAAFEAEAIGRLDERVLGAPGRHAKPQDKAGQPWVGWPAEWPTRLARWDADADGDEARLDADQSSPRRPAL